MERGWTGEARLWPVGGVEGLTSNSFLASVPVCRIGEQLSWAQCAADTLPDPGQALSLSKSIHVVDFISYSSFSTIM